MEANTTTVSTINYADTVWVLVCTLLVFIMVPGAALFYAGTTKSKNRLSMMLVGFLSVTVVSLQWFFWGYSLTFSATGSKFIGNLDNIVLINVGNTPHPLAPTIPENLLMVFQNMFAATTAVLVIGSVAERFSLFSFIVFLVIWSTFVYDIVACWVWGPFGWLRQLGIIDFAGGIPVHIVSGFSSLAYAVVIGPRSGFPKNDYPAVNVGDVFIGTSLTWFGWFGFNGGSTILLNSSSVDAIITSNIAASVAALSWVFMEMILNRNKKFSLYGFCCGSLSGLVVITPAAGYVSPQISLIFGLFAGVFCCLGRSIKKIKYLRFDDACDVFAVHGIGGITGTLLAGIFVDKNVASMSGVELIPVGGWMNGNFMQILYQLAGCVAGMTWSFTVTFIILKLINLIPFLKLRITDKDEDIGIDWVQLGERSYGHDIVEVNE